MSAHFTRRSAVAAGLALGVSLAATTPTLAQAATKRLSTDAEDSAGITRLQWSAVALTAEQYPVMKEFTEKALGLALVFSSAEFAVFSAPDGTLFELYGPKAPPAPWRTGTASAALGLDARNLAMAGKVLERNGARRVSPVHVLRGAGAGGTNLRYCFFRAPDNRVYRLAQTNADPDEQVSESAAGAAGIKGLDFGGVSLTSEQFPRMKAFVEDGLGFSTLILDGLGDIPEYGIFLAENRSRFELYGPAAPQLPWRTGPTSMAMGFKSFDLDKAMANLEQNGAEWVTPIFVYDNRFRFFRAPDNRIYSISETPAT
ncbi:VOC family protein [Streptomyces sp. NPDC006602]|uniref:VOC family protein n=1 Tax=Streptomyces sp. NPDC006602 TaxID=3364751 RepID=UPI0036BFDCD6